MMPVAGALAAVSLATSVVPAHHDPHCDRTREHEQREQQISVRTVHGNLTVERCNAGAAEARCLLVERRGGTSWIRTTTAQPGDMGQMTQMGDGMGGCPCMQMHQMMTDSPMGWVVMIAGALLLLAAIAALVSLSVFLIPRSRSTVTS